MIIHCRCIKMHGVTANDLRVMDFLVRHFRERHSINGIASQLGFSPNGAYKILKKLEQMHALIPEKIGNAIYYKAHLESETGNTLAAYVLSQHKLDTYARVQAVDLEKMKKDALSIVIFGSVLTKGTEAGDIDVLIILEKKNLRKIQGSLHELKEIKPKRIHEVYQTPEDLVRNIKKDDEVILDIIKTGKILWGSGIIVEAIKNATSGS